MCSLLVASKIIYTLCVGGWWGVKVDRYFGILP